MRAVLDIALRDLRARLRDRSAIVIGFLAPLALMFIFGQLVRGPDVERQPLGFVASGADTFLDQALVDAAFPALVDEGVITVHDYADRDAAVAALDDEQIDAAFVVTSRDPGSAAIEVIRRPGATIGGSIGEGVADSVAARANAVAALVTAGAARGDPIEPAAADAALDAQPERAEARTADTAAGGLDAKTQVATGMATFFLFFTVQFGLIGLLQERREGTLRRLLAAPVTPRQVLVAKLLVSYALGVLSMVMLFVAARLLLGADFGAPLGVALLILAGVAAATATVTLVVGLTKTSEQAAVAQSMVALVLGLVGGSFFSLVRGGGIGATLTKLTPHYWFGEGLVRMTGGHGWTAALPAVARLVVFAAVVAIPGLLLARRTVRP